MKVKMAPDSGHVTLELGRKDDELPAQGQPGPAAQFKLRKILVPVDFSDCSRKALQYAIPLAREFGAGVTLLHVAQSSYYATDLGVAAPVFPEEEVREACAGRLAALARSEIGNHAPTATEVRFGQPVGEITEAALALEIDLIIIATHGRTGLKHMLLGSVAENVVRHAPCPVLVVREREHEFITSTRRDGAGPAPVDGLA